MKNPNIQTLVTTPEEVRELLDSYGVVIRSPDLELQTFVDNYLILPEGVISRSHKCWNVTNATTERLYEETKMKSLRLVPERLLWHGSLNKNWLSIVLTGLSVDHASSGMFGRGIYFADKAIKSYGYTSGKGSIYGKGNKNSFFLGVFKVNLGKVYYAHRPLDSVPAGYDSVAALVENTTNWMNEFVVYADSRCTIYGLVEIEVE